jgi:hypothetical protein
MTLGAQPSYPLGGFLISSFNYPGDALSNAQFKTVVHPPAGMSDCDFIRVLPFTEPNELNWWIGFFSALVARAWRWRVAALGLS